MNENINTDLLRHVEQMKKSITAIASQIPKMIEDNYKNMSPEDGKKYAEALRDSDAENQIRNVSEIINKMNNRK